MPNGILDYENYLNTLQTLTEIGNMFPSEQKTFRYNIEGGGTQGWTATVSYKTLIVDRVKFDRDDRPNFSDSTVIGYYTGTNFNEYSTGTISLPANMYTGGILPASLVNIPITVVNVQWNKEGTTYANNIGFIQNWEPGVTPADPTLTEGFVPIFQASPSTLTLTGMDLVPYGATLTLEARTSISDVDLGFTSRVYFYWNATGTNVLLGTAFFNRQTGIATLNVPTTLPVLGLQPNSPVAGNPYPMFAVFNGIRQYGRVVSNTINQRLGGLVNLIPLSQTFTPTKTVYVLGDNIDYNLTVVPDPAAQPLGIEITNTMTVKTVYYGTIISNQQKQFANGGMSASLPQVTTSNYFFFKGYDVYSADGGFYTATITNAVLTTNTYTVTERQRWKNRVESRIYNKPPYWYWNKTIYPPSEASQTITSPYFTVENIATYVVTASTYPMVFDMGTNYPQNRGTYFQITVPSGKYHSNPITVYYRPIGSTATGTFLYSFNWPHYGIIQFSLNTIPEGNWEVYARLNGDFGTSTDPAKNITTSTSNIKTITVLPPVYNTLNAQLTFQRTTSSDILRFIANTTTDINTAITGKVVTFYQGSTNLGSQNLVKTASQNIETLSSLTNIASTSNQLINQLGRIRNITTAMSTSNYILPNENSLIGQRSLFTTGPYFWDSSVFDPNQLSVDVLLDAIEPPLNQLILGFKEPITNLPRLFTVTNFSFAFMATTATGITTATGAYNYIVEPYFNIGANQFTGFPNWNGAFRQYQEFARVINDRTGTWSRAISPNWPLLYNRYNWISTNINDGNEQRRVAGINALYNAYVNQEKITILGKDESQTYTTNPNLQIATLVLPLNTINNLNTVYATWPGTIGLGDQFGDFYPVVEYVQGQGIPSITTISNAILYKPNGDFSKAPGQSTRTFFDNPISLDFNVGKVYSTNWVYMTAKVAFNPDTYSNLSFDFLNAGGSVTFFDPISNTNYFTTSTDANGVAVFPFNANTVTNLTDGSNVQIAAKWSGNNASTSTSTSKVIQAIRSRKTQPLNFQFNGPLSYIPRTYVYKNLTRADIPDWAKLHGQPLDIEIKINWRVDLEYPFPINTGLGYVPTGQRIYSANGFNKFLSKIWFRVNGLNPLAINPSSEWAWVAAKSSYKSTSNYQGDFVGYNSSGSWFDDVWLPASTFPVIRANGSFNNLKFNDDWTSIELYVEFEGYYIDREWYIGPQVWTSRIGPPCSVIVEPVTFTFTY